MPQQHSIVGFAGLAWYVAMMVVAAVKKQFKRYFVLSWEVSIVATVLIALSPLALVIWLVDTLCDKLSRAAAKQ